MYKGKHLFLFLLSLVTFPKSCISMLEDGYFLQLSRLRLRSPHQLSFSLFKETQCCLRCLQYTGCKSVNFDMRDGTCEINFFGPQSHGVKTEVNQSWVLYYKPNAEDRELMFRATAGNGISVRDTWLGTTKSPPAEDACISMATGACSTHYRNPKVDLWNTLPIAQVILELYKEGSLVMFMTFNGTASKIESWMSHSRLLSSSWTKLSPDTHFTYFSLTGDSYCSCVFLIQQSYGECVKDTGWFVVLDPFLTPPDCCKWSDLPNKPKFVYSMDDNMTTFQDGHVGFADVLALYVKYE